MYHSIKVLNVLFEINLCIQAALGFSQWALGNGWRQKKGRYVINPFVGVCWVALCACGWEDVPGGLWVAGQIYVVVILLTWDYFIHFIKVHKNILHLLLTKCILPNCLHKDDKCKTACIQHWSEWMKGWILSCIFPGVSSWQKWAKETWYFILCVNIKS